VKDSENVFISPIRRISLTIFKIPRHQSVLKLDEEIVFSKLEPKNVLSKSVFIAGGSEDMFFKRDIAHSKRHLLHPLQKMKGE
jgi:hypothetical protein